MLFTVSTKKHLTYAQPSVNNGSCRYSVYEKISTTANLAVDKMLTVNILQGFFKRLIVK